MKRIEIREYNNFEFMISKNSAEIIIKISLENSTIQEVSNQMNEIMGEDYLDRPGVYFLRLSEGFYIGKAKNLKQRFLQHYANKKISFITFATHKSKLERMENTMIQDLESLLLSYAHDYGLNIGGSLTNKKNENRKTTNILLRRENGLIAKEIWNKFAQLNVMDLLEEKYSSEMDEIPKVKNIKGNPNSMIKKKSTFIKTIAVNKNTQDHIVDSIDPLFTHVQYRENIAPGYNRTKIEMFNKEYSKLALFEYLYLNSGNMSIDKKLSKGTRDRGYITAVTLAYFRIETNGKTRGSLTKLNSDIAKSLIDKFVDKYY